MHHRRRYMKKFISIILVFVILAAIAALPTYAAEDFTYVHIVAGGNDPYATIRFNSSGKNAAIDPDVVK